MRVWVELDQHMKGESTVLWAETTVWFRAMSVESIEGKRRENFLEGVHTSRTRCHQRLWPCEPNENVSIWIGS